MQTEKLYKIFLQNPAIQTDSRKIKPGDLFFALTGPNFNGNAFAEKAVEQGAAYAIIDKPEYQKDERYIIVRDVLKTLQKLAKHHRQQSDIPVIAITGSNGKTTTKELLTAVLRKKFRTQATEGNLNNHIGVPLTLLKLKKDTEIAIVEMGANHLHEIEAYCQIALPTHGIITNCGKAHIEGFGSEEGVRKAKGELYDFLRDHNGTIFRNADLSYLQEMSNGIMHQITYGTANAKYIGRPLSEGLFLKMAVLSSGSETSVQTQLVGDYNFPNVMAAIAGGRHFGIPVEQIKEAIENYRPDNSRSQYLKAGTNHIILDAYNANPTSMKAAISNFARASVQRKMLWIGAMKEMGAEEAAEHEALVDYIKKFDWENVILVGAPFYPCRNGFTWFESSDEAAEFIKASKPEQAAILIKGSRGSKMEKLLEALKD